MFSSQDLDSSVTCVAQREVCKEQQSSDVEELDDDDPLELQVDLLSEGETLLKEWWEVLEHSHAD